MPVRLSRSVHRPHVVFVRFPACIAEVVAITVVNLLALVAQAIWFVLVVPSSAVIMLIVIACDSVDDDVFPWLPRQQEEAKQFIFLPLDVKNTFVESLEKRMAAYVESQASLY